MTAQEKQHQLLHNVPAEMTLCLSCCEVALTKVDNGAVRRSMEKQINWTILIETALWHHIGPTVFRILLENHAHRLPGTAFAQLKLTYERLQRQSEIITDELQRIANHFSRAKIRMIPLKGPMLAQQLYGDVHARSCGDLDLLVMDADIHASLDILDGLGYSYQTPRTTRQEAAFRNCTGQHQIVRDDGEVTVELHWRVAQSLAAVPIDYQSLWSAASQKAFQDEPVWSLHLEDLPIVLCIHGGKEHWVRLKWICDIAHYVSIKTEQLRWLDIMEKARSQGCHRMLLVGVGVAHNLMSVSIPDVVQHEIERDKITNDLVAEISQQLVHSRNPSPSIWSLTKFRFQVRERWRDRLMYAARTLFTPKAVHFEMLKLPDYLFALYYAVRVGHDYVLLPIWTRYKALRVKLEN